MHQPIGAELAYVGAAQQGLVDIDLAAQQRERARGTGFATDGQAIHGRPADEHALRAQRQRLEHVIPMEFRQIQYFVCLYEEGAVTRAARRLNIVQPALSMQIAKLEEEVGHKLFVRTPQGMQPTSEGRRMYRLFLPVLSDFSRAREQVMH